MTRLMCPHCGWTYDPSINGEGYDLVPNHWFKAVDCPGQQQHPRNAESDKRPLWSEEQLIEKLANPSRRAMSACERLGATDENKETMLG